MSTEKKTSRVVRDLDVIVARWRAGVCLTELALEYGVAKATMRECILSRVPANEYGVIAERHKIEGMVRKRRAKLLTVRMWKHSSAAKGGRPQRRRFIKVGCDPTDRNKNWIPLSRWLWERERGPVPDGCYVGHIDGDPKNDSLENLCLRSRAEAARVAVSRCDGRKRAAKISRTRKATEAVRRRIIAARSGKLSAFGGQDAGEAA